MNWPYPGAAWYVAVVRGLQVMPVDCLHAGMWYVRMCLLWSPAAGPLVADSAAAPPGAPNGQSPMRLPGRPVALLDSHSKSDCSSL